MPLTEGFGTINGFASTKKAAPLYDVHVEVAINSGALGYLIKQTSADSVCPAIREVHNGNTFFSPSIPKRLHERNQKK